MTRRRYGLRPTSHRRAPTSVSSVAGRWGAKRQYGKKMRYVRKTHRSR